MKTYDTLSKVTFLKKYSFKFLFVAFLGIHIPLIGMILFLSLGGGEALTPLSVIISALIFTLLATGITLYILNKLLEPIILAKESLSEYIVNKEIPSLPTKYKDEIGILMSEIQYSINSLDELLEEKQDLIGLMSHDLKNPLAAVMNYSEVIPRAETLEQRENIKTKIISAANTQKQIIDSVLDMLEREEIVITEKMKEEFDVEPLLDEVLGEYKEKLDEKNIKVEKKIMANKINAKRDVFKQVLSNLLSNSIKFTNEGGEINIATDVENDYSKITISDNGIGFKPEDSSKLFHRFTKYGKKGTRGESSTGLGLYLCKKIVEKHKGHIEAYSEGEGKGAEFKILLPGK